MIQPSNGRVVLFTPGADFRGTWLDRMQPLTAQICHVFGDRMVNLLVTDSYGVQFPVTSVDLVQSPADLAAVQTSGRYAEWMPYQKGQAAKTEQLEQKLATEKT